MGGIHSAALLGPPLRLEGHDYNADGILRIFSREVKREGSGFRNQESEFRDCGHPGVAGSVEVAEEWLRLFTLNGYTAESTASPM